MLRARSANTGIGKSIKGFDRMEIQKKKIQR
jgi:hypothetical protein